MNDLLHLVAATEQSASITEPLLFSIGLMLAAMLLLILEVIFVSFGILGAGSLLCACFGIYQAFVVSSEYGLSLAIATPIMAVIAIRFGIKRIQNSALAPAAAINGQAGARSHTDQLGIDIGSIGTLLTDVSPGGRCRFDGGTCDVVTRGPPLDAGQRVIVKDIDGPSILVVAHQQPASTPPSSPEES